MSLEFHLRGSVNRELLPRVVDWLARERPDVTYGLWPVGITSYDADIYTISYSQLANIVDSLAWLIAERLGTSQTSEVLTYVGPDDVRLTAMVLAAIKTGYVVSHRVIATYAAL